MKTLKDLGFKRLQQVNHILFVRSYDRLEFYGDGSMTCYFKSTLTQEIFDAIQLELKKPKLTEEVKQLLRLLPPELKWAACDSGGSIYAYERKPVKKGITWMTGYCDFQDLDIFKHLLSPLISWNDTEPTNLDEWRALL